MTCDACRTVWNGAADNDKARALDAQHPNCACEPCSLRIAGGTPVTDDEVVARIITSPSDYNEDTGDVLTRRLTSLYGAGVSLVRSGASDDEIKETIFQLTGGPAAQNKLVGAAILKALDIRRLGNPEKWFCVYDTNAGEKKHHGDIAGTSPSGTNSQIEKQQKVRRYKLKDELSNKLVLAADTDALIVAMRAAGI